MTKKTEKQLTEQIVNAKQKLFNVVRDDGTYAYEKDTFQNCADFIDMTCDEVEEKIVLESAIKKEKETETCIKYLSKVEGGKYKKVYYHIEPCK